jgi:ATP-dependent Clp protease protease subunit
MRILVLAVAVLGLGTAAQAANYKSQRQRSVVNRGRLVKAASSRELTLLAGGESKALHVLRSIQDSLVIPNVIEKTPHGERGLDLYSKLLSNRIIMLGGPIDDQVSELVTAQLLHLEAEDPEKDIQLYIQSPGGSVLSGLAIYDTMQLIKPDVVTVSVGHSASMAALLLASGSPKKRFSLPHSRILIHQPWVDGIRGQATDIAIQAREMAHTRGVLENIFHEHTGQPLKKLHKDMERDNIMSAQQAKAYHIIDEVLTQRQ